jgi:hypothetical protein
MTIARYLSHSSLALIFALATGEISSAQIFNAGENSSASNHTSMKMDSEVKQSSWPSIPLPKITMPQVSMPDMSIITTPVKSGYDKVTAGTKKAWEGTKEIFTFGKGDSAPARRSQPKASIWQRMFSTEPDKKDGPQTVGEWMAQPRLEP